MGMFGQAKDMYLLQKKAKQIKKDLQNLHIEAEFEGVIVIINGEQEVIDVKISDEMMLPENKMKLAKALITAFNKAVKKSQEIAAERMRDVMGDLGLPGLAGGSDKPAA